MRKKVTGVVLLSLVVSMLISSLAFAGEHDLTKKVGTWYSNYAQAPKGQDVYYLNRNKKKGNIVFSVEVNTNNLKNKRIRAAVMPENVYKVFRGNPAVLDAIKTIPMYYRQSIDLRAEDQYYRVSRASNIENPVLVVDYDKFQPGESLRVFYNDKTVYPTSLKVPKKKKVKKGQTFTIVKSAVPADAMHFDEVDGVYFKSSKPKVVSVDSATGILKAKKKGKATITAICYKTGKKYKCKVTVKGKK